MNLQNQFTDHVRSFMGQMGFDVHYWTETTPHNQDAVVIQFTWEFEGSPIKFFVTASGLEIRKNSGKLAMLARVKVRAAMMQMIEAVVGPVSEKDAA